MTSIASNARQDAPIGVFDSGVGGLSVLRHIRAQLPQEDLIYFADSGYAPYGDKSEEQVIARSLAITAFLLQQGAKALVVACNTATIAAIKALRARYPDLPIVGVEPGLKPAAAISRNGTIGVLATERALRGDKLLALREQVSVATGATFILQPCIGLADRIEQCELGTDPQDATSAMLERYIAPLLAQGADTLVLGFADMGMEAIYEFDVVDMPVTVAVDAKGTSVHNTGPKEWQAKIEQLNSVSKIPVTVA